MDRSARSTPDSASASSTPSKRRQVIPPLKRAQTIAMRSPRPEVGPSRYSPTLARNPSLISGSKVVSSLDVIESSKHVTEFFPLGPQVLDVEGGRAALERDALGDVETESFEPPILAGVIGHQAHRRDPQVDEDLRPDPVLARIDGQSEFQVGVDGVAAILLKCVGADLVTKSDTATFVTTQIDHDPCTFSGDLGQRRLELGSAVATHRAEDVAGEALRMDPHQHIAPARDVAVDERDVLFAVEDTLEDERLELAVLGGK